jgi:hypothetical protein
MSVFTFFENQTSNATSPVYFVQDGGYRLIKATGVFGSGTVTIEVDFGDGLFAPILAYQFTASDVKEIQPLKNNVRLRAVLTGATGTTNITVKII